MSACCHAVIPDTEWRERYYFDRTVVPAAGDSQAASAGVLRAGVD